MGKDFLRSLAHFLDRFFLISHKLFDLLNFFRAFFTFYAFRSTTLTKITTTPFKSKIKIRYFIKLKVQPHNTP